MHGQENRSQPLEIHAPRIQAKTKPHSTVLTPSSSNPSITEELLNKAIEFARQFTEIQDHESDIIVHTKRTVVLSEGEPWKKKDDTGSGFDVTMGNF